MKSSDLSREQAETLKRQIGTRLQYFNRLLDRMTQRGWLPGDPLYLGVVHARNALQDLHSEGRAGVREVWRAEAG